MSLLSALRYWLFGVRPDYVAPPLPEPDSDASPAPETYTSKPSA